MPYAQALSEYADAGGYDLEVTWDVCTVGGAGRCLRPGEVPRAAAPCPAASRSGWCWSSCSRGPDEVLLLDEPDNFLDVPGKIWLEQRIRESDKTILFISHDRELLDNTATRVVTVELGAAGNLVWTHPGGLRVVPRGAQDRFLRFEEMRRRWDEEHAKLKALVLQLKIKAEYNDGMASRSTSAAQTRLRKFEEAGPPIEQPREQQVTMRLKGGRTGKRAVVCENLELTGLMKPFDLEVWYGERVAVLGSNGSGKSHFLRLLAAGGSDPDVEHRPVGDVAIKPVRHTGKAKLGARVRPGWFVQTHEHPELVGRTLLEILHRGDGSPDGRAGMGREQAARVLDRYELAHAAEQRFESLVRRAAGAVPDPAARAVRRHAAAARRADRQPRRAVGRGARGRARGVRRHRARGDPRPLVRPRLRPVPRLRRRRRRLRVGRAGLGRGTGGSGPDERAGDRATLDPFDTPTFDAWHAVYDAAEHATGGGDRRRRGARRAARDRCRSTARRWIRHGSSGWSTDRSSSAGCVAAAAARQPRPRRARRPRAPRRTAGTGLRRRDAGAARGGRPGARPRRSLVGESPGRTTAGPTATATPGVEFAPGARLRLALGDVQRRLDLPVADGDPGRAGRRGGARTTPATRSAPGRARSPRTCSRLGRG